MKVVCAHCGVTFSSPVLYFRRQDGRDFYCPNGHGLTFKETIAAERAAAEAERQRVADEVEALEDLYARVPTVAEHVRYVFSKHIRARRFQQ